ncbi:hypothetical protein [Prosthecobacter sp.]|uniref:hypothetical protein n=1 Tax=Prosthecobacter sp. TaxID=1965333 RepID=UPI00378440E7
MDLADALEALEQRRDFINPDPTWLVIMREHARDAGRGADRAESPRLWHSITNSLATQIKDAALAAGGASAIRSLSPFHDTDGGVLRRMAHEVGAASLTIGLLPEKHEETTFPFNSGKRAAVKIMAAEISTGDEDEDFMLSDPSRRLHAKWLELDLRDDTRLMITGSVNATTKSLETTDNIEVALMRRPGHRSPPALRWKKVTAPETHKRQDFRGAGLRGRAFVHARLSKDVLSGQMLGRGVLAGSWQVALEDSGGSVKDFILEVDEKGAFSKRLADLGQFGASATLQLTMHLEDRTACGWVSVEMYLNMARTGLMSVGTLLRHLNGQATFEDDIVLLNFIMESAMRHLHGLEEAPATADNPKTPKASGPVNTSLIDLERLATVSRDQSLNETRSNSASTTQLSHLIDELRKRLRLRLSQETANHATETEDESDGGIEDTEKGDSRVTEALDRFEAMIRDSLRGGSPKQRTIALMMWREVRLAMMLDHARDPGTIEAFLRRWLNAACRNAPKPASAAPTQLDRHIFSTAAFLAAGRRRNAGVVLQALHEEIQTYMEGEPRLDFIEAALAEGIEPALRQLFPKQAAGMQEAILEILCTPSLGEQIQNACAWLGGRGSQPDKRLALFQTQTGELLARALDTPEMVRFTLRKDEREACPHCHQRLSHAGLSELNYHRLSQCGNERCQRFIFDPRLPEPHAD